MNPADQRLLCDQLVAVFKQGDLPRTEEFASRILAAQPIHFEANHILGIIRAQQERFAEALERLNAALATNPEATEALRHRGNVLMALGRQAEAKSDYDKSQTALKDFSALTAMAAQQQGEQALEKLDRALAIRPYSVEAWNSRGGILMDLKRLEDALESFDRSLAIEPNIPEGLYNRGNILQDLKRFDEALACYDKALAIRPSFIEAQNNRGITLWSLQRFDDATAAFKKALAVKPTFARALNNLGGILCENNHIDEGLDAFTQHAQMIYGTAGFSGENTSPHKLKHDTEQLAYLAEQGAAASSTPSHLKFHLMDGDKLSGPAVNPTNAGGDVAEQWRNKHPQIAVVDNFLTPEALEKLRRFCRGSTVWRRSYPDGYLGAMAEHGFASPLIGQIAEELRTTFPDIFRAHPLCYLWAFKYDSSLAGIGIHADAAAVNVNFWITPDEANLDPDSGGLVVWDVAAPLDWDFEKFNNDGDAIRDFLAQNNAKSVTIPYRANRAVIFDSDLFHATDTIKFKDGYLNRRINITLLYGRRES